MATGTSSEGSVPKRPRKSALSTSSEGSVPKRPRKSALSLVENTEMPGKILALQALPPVEIPGFFSLVSEEEVRKAILDSASHGLFLIRLKAKEGPGLSALSKGAGKGKDKEDSLSFSQIGKCVQATIQDEVFQIPFGALFGDALLTPSDGLIKQLCKDLHLLAHVVKCSAVSEISSTNLEPHHNNVFALLCDLVLGPNIVILQECQVGTAGVPHGTLDLVAGVMKRSEESASAFTLGVTIDGEEIFLQDAVGIEAKTPKTMKVGVINAQPAVQACVFDEVQKATSDSSVKTPTVYLSANAQYFRPFIRVKQHDLLLSTTNRILWNQPPEDGPGVQYVGAVFLLLLLKSATCVEPVYPTMETDVIEHYIRTAGIRRQQLSSGWSEYYDTCDLKYGNIVPQRHSRATKPKQPKTKPSSATNVVTPTQVLF